RGADRPRTPGTESGRSSVGPLGERGLGLVSPQALLLRDPPDGGDLGPLPVDLPFQPLDAVGRAVPPEQRHQDLVVVVVHAGLLFVMGHQWPSTPRTVPRREAATRPP